MNSTPSSEGIDARGIPSHVCVACGNDTFIVRVWFEDYNIAGWSLNGLCANCDTPVTVPCPVDDPNFVPEDSE